MIIDVHLLHTDGVICRKTTHQFLINYLNIRISVQCHVVVTVRNCNEVSSSGGIERNSILILIVTATTQIETDVICYYD